MSSLKVTVAILVAFLLLTFWGVLAQAQGGSVEAGDRFFKSYFVWVLGVVPLPAFKCLSLIAGVNLLASLAFRMPRGFKFAGLWMMHVALLVLLFGSVAGSEFKREYNGYSMSKSASTEATAEIQYFSVDDSLGMTPVKIDAGSWLYTVRYQGYVEMSEGRFVALYKACYDPFHFVPYVFMALFLLGALFHYSLRKSRFGKGNLRLFLPMVMLWIAFSPTHLSAMDRPETLWENLSGENPVKVDSALRPFDSFARGFLDDLSGRVTYKCQKDDFCEGRLDATNVVRSILLSPDAASHLALFKVLRGDVLSALHLPEYKRYVSYAELRGARTLLTLYASRNDNHPATHEMSRLLRNVQRYESLSERSAFSPVVSKENPWRLSVEVFYHRANLALWGFALALMAGLLALINLIFKSRKLDAAANGFCMGASAVLGALFALRTYVAQRPPFVSLYEIVLLVSLLLLAFESGAFFFCKKRTFSLIVPVSLMAAVLLFCAKFVLEPGDTFQAIPAVLNSSVFLTLHVVTIAIGFASVILSGVVAHLVLFRGKKALPSKENPKGSPLYSLLYGTLVLGGVFTVLGTLLGGVWADFAWGRFWGFDPKENGALFVILWTMLLLHLRAGRLVQNRVFVLMNCFNVIVTFLCWFGINLLGVGLHSYGFESVSTIWLSLFVALDLAVIAIIYVAKRRTPSK